MAESLAFIAPSLSCPLPISTSIPDGESLCSKSSIHLLTVSIWICRSKRKSAAASMASTLYFSRTGAGVERRRPVLASKLFRISSAFWGLNWASIFTHSSSLSIFNCSFSFRKMTNIFEMMDFPSSASRINCSVLFFCVFRFSCFISSSVRSI